MNSKNSTIIIGVLVAALLIASIGWYRTSKALAEGRAGFSTVVINACEDLTTESNRDDCADRLEELTGLLTKYQRDIKNLDLTATTTDEENGESTTTGTGSAQ